jgi:hypothetical protein
MATRRLVDFYNNPLLKNLDKCPEILSIHLNIPIQKYQPHVLLQIVAYTIQLQKYGTLPFAIFFFFIHSFYTIYVRPYVCTKSPMFACKVCIQIKYKKMSEW